MAARRIGFWLSITFLFVSCLYDLISCPHSKVEESFQLQATHDLYYHGISPALQRHTLSGWEMKMIQLFHMTIYIVPRTFAGPIILSFLSRFILLPCILLNIEVDPNFVQFLARFCLMLFNVFGWVRLALVVDRIPGILSSSSTSSSPFNITTGSWLLLITASQFHIPFYSSRMLPNTFALSIVLQSYAYWIQNRIKPAATLLVIGTVIFRCDLLLLLGSMGMSWLFHRQISIPTALKIGILTGIVSLILTVPIDSLLWQRIVWPEGEVLYFNTVLGKSKEYGLSPWHWYFTTALPKAMLFTLLLVPLSIFRIAEVLVAMEQRWRDPKINEDNHNNDNNRAVNGSNWLPVSTSMLVDTQWSRFILPIFGFVGLYSFLGHKEMRFIFPALPILNLGAAVGLSKLARLAFPSPLYNKDKGYVVSFIARFGFGCGLLCLILTLCGSLAFVAVSKSNYSGGDALRELSLHVQNVASSASSNDDDVSKNNLSPIYVHVDVAAAMSGVSLFGQRAAAQTVTSPSIEWKFSKDGYEEGMSVGQDDGYEQFTHLLSEDPNISPSIFNVIHTQQGKPRLSLRERKIVTEDTIFILERRNWT
ncbi:dolichyl-phosphate-mannose-protein mannosyltransferase [Fragilariopsis cylindrus CCMP1102]|uniref:Mannosyltransferase n=1 Tax=Fragilariopsis cylindrus CCMP1102 TaxID=635003 RepID=A0A1E7EWP8_9STRA|nr:dolichyl-phosphate-mannose-protein mannosyltransferase [Fragilariopsis cylindrus CCMP1102]|eukprot:OEU10286.1 dolichyl-phosphate-mannose-protein mannosyltransferase [Fragilariopsis cylindrus CCMP1102]